MWQSHWRRKTNNFWWICSWTTATHKRHFSARVAVRWAFFPERSAQPAELSPVDIWTVWWPKPRTAPLPVWYARNVHVRFDKAAYLFISQLRHFRHLEQRVAGGQFSKRQVWNKRNASGKLKRATFKSRTIPANFRTAIAAGKGLHDLWKRNPKLRSRVWRAQGMFAEDVWIARSRAMETDFDNTSYLLSWKSNCTRVWRRLAQTIRTPGCLVPWLHGL